MYFYTLTKFVSLVGGHVDFLAGFGAVGVAIGALTVFLIFKFDKPYMKAVNEKNEKEHIVSGSLFDSLSNILTVITLRLEKHGKKACWVKWAIYFRPLRNYASTNGNGFRRYDGDPHICHHRRGLYLPALHPTGFGIHAG